MRITLLLAGVHAAIWGVWLIAAPWTFARWGGGSDPGHVWLWHCFGLMVAVLGAGYLIASGDPLRHWPVVLMGLGAKLGVVYMVEIAVKSGQIMRETGYFVAGNELIWALPFALILGSAHDAALGQRRAISPELLRMALRRKTQYGVNLHELSQISPILVVFLRHAGCTFCREALTDLAAKRKAIEEAGARLVLVHMGSEDHADKFFARYGLEDVARISDPERGLYKAFGLPRGTLFDLFGPKVWWRGFQAGILGRHGVGRLVGDGFQMPGIFLMFHGEILRSYRHQSAADRPDYLALVTGKEYAAKEFST